MTASLGKTMTSMAKVTTKHDENHVVAGCSLAFFQLAVASLNLSWWGMVGSVSFKRAISVCMNLLKALSFFFPPPPDDLVFRGGFSVAAFFSVVAIG